MKRVAIVSPHFPPSNLVGAQRARLLARHLPRFGWEPIIVTVDARYYEEPLDEELMQLVSPSLEIVRARALGTRPFRLVGDIGIRGFCSMYRALKKLIQTKDVRLVYISIPSNFAAMLGPLVRRRFGTPYAIDFMDPWAHDWPGSERPLTKAWMSRKLAYWLEPIALRRCALVTAVAPGYYRGLLERYQWLSPERCVAVPFGMEPQEFEALKKIPRTLFLFDPNDGDIHFVYAGAMLPRAYGTLDALLVALRELHASRPDLARRIRFHFVGTGGGVRERARGFENHIFEHAARVPLFDVLNHLRHATAVLILGSSEKHYSPSKTYQAILSQRPVLALLHRDSLAIDVLERANAGAVVAFADDDEAMAKSSDIAAAVEHCVEKSADTRPLNWDALKPYTTEEYTRRLAGAFDRVVAGASS